MNQDTIIEERGLLTPLDDQSDHFVLIVAHNREAVWRASLRTKDRWERVFYDTESVIEWNREERVPISRAQLEPVCEWIGDPCEVERGWLMVFDSGGTPTEPAARFLLQILREELQHEGVYDAMLLQPNEYDHFSTGPGKYLRQWGESIEFAPLPSLVKLITVIQHVLPDRGYLILGAQCSGPHAVQISDRLSDTVARGPDGRPLALGTNVGGHTVPLLREPMSKLFDLIDQLAIDNTHLTHSVQAALDDRIVVMASAEGPHQRYMGFRVWYGLHEDALTAFRRL